MLELDQFLGGRALRRQQLLQFAQRWSDRRVLITQTLEELDAAGGREPRTRQLAQCHRRVVRIVAEAEQAIGELVGDLAIRPAAHDPFGDPSQVLDEQDAQADGDRPQLAGRQRLHLLVGAHHPPQALGIEPAVGVGDVRPRQPEHAWISVEVAAGKLRELPVVVGREVVADLADLLVDDREVVDQPLGRRCDRALLPDRLGQHPIRLDQHATVVRHARPDRRPSIRPGRTCWAAASVPACCSRRSMLNSSATIGCSASGSTSPRRLPASETGNERPACRFPFSRTGRGLVQSPRSSSSATSGRRRSTPCRPAVIDCSTRAAVSAQSNLPNGSSVSGRP